MNALPLAFLLGFLGSLHCALMCGPLMLSMPMPGDSRFASFLQLLLYQFGRILVYGLLGLLVGAIGNSVRVFTSQETLSWIVGLLLVLFALLHISKRRPVLIARLQQRMTAPIATLLGRFYGKPFWGFFVGMLNGLIPCGMVYLALATALNGGTMQAGAIFMLWFGLGTAPLMLGLSLGKIWLNKYLRFNVNAYMPWFMLFFGLLMIMRAAELDIAFLSPSTFGHAHQHVAECK